MYIQIKHGIQPSSSQYYFLHSINLNLKAPLINVTGEEFCF